MKKLLLIAIIAGSMNFGGCAVYTAQTIKYSTDYGRHINRGFWVSPMETYAGYKYIPLASITIEYGEEIGFNASDGMTPDVMLDMLVDEAKIKGADGLIAVKINRQRILNQRPTWIATGVAIKFNGETPLNDVSIITTLPDTKYDLKKALEISKSDQLPLIGKIGDNTLYLDPETKTYLKEVEFTDKYGASQLYQLNEFAKTARTPKPLYIRGYRQDRLENVSSQADTILYLDESTGKYINEKKYIKKYGNEKFQELNNKICVTK